MVDEIDLDELLHGVRSIDVPDWLKYDRHGVEIPDLLPILREIREGR